MSSPASFDPCRMWLGISALELSDPRRVLGLSAGPVDPVMVMAHAEQRIAHLRNVQAGAYETARSALLARVEQARDALLTESTATQAAHRPQSGFSMPPPPPGVAVTPAPMGGHPPSGFGHAPHPSMPAAFNAPQPSIALRDRPRRRRDDSGAGGLVLVLAVAVLGVGGVGGLLWMQSRSAPPAGEGRTREVAMAEPARVAREASTRDDARRTGNKEEMSNPSAESSEPEDDRATSGAQARSGPSSLDSVPDAGIRPPDRSPDPPPPGRGPPPRDRRNRSEGSTMEEDETAPMQRPGGRPSPGAGKTVDATDTTEPPEMDETKPSPAKRPGARSMERDPTGDMADEDAPSDDAKNPPGKNPAMASTDTPSKGAPQAADGDGDDAKAGPIIDAAVEKAFAALVDSDFEAADAALEPARKATKDRAEAERVDGWQLLVEYAKGFEDYRMQAIAAVKGGDEYDVPRSKGEGEMRVGIVDVADGNMSFRVEGQTLSKPLDKLPSNLLMAILKKWFDDNPANNLYLGAYHLTRPEPDLATAERLWSTALVRGADAAPLLPLLDEPVIRRAAAGE